ncbi:MAG: hypothetical protein OEM59_15280, partial [Rhodospirillales bacterium]|nr:hypothetical protein [Rhodospirillales bacterium]
EFGRLVPYFQQQGFDAIYCDPRELALSRKGAIIAEDKPVDVIYRFLEIRDLIDIEAEAGTLHALRAAFERNMVVPSAGGDLEHKSVFEVLSDPRYERAFSEEQREVLRDHVLWTRLVYERKTTGPDGSEIDLVPFIERRRADLVLKPNRLSGGEGVVLGNRVDGGTWQAALQAAASAPGSHVVQLLSPSEAEEFPEVNASGVHIESRFCVTGLFPGRRGVGAFGRYASSGVVNIQAGGGIAPFLVCVR